MAARSPGFSNTGPDVDLMATRISRAMMFARVVLPKPGGAENQRVIQRLSDVHGRPEQISTFAL